MKPLFLVFVLLCSWLKAEQRMSYLSSPNHPVINKTEHYIMHFKPDSAQITLNTLPQHFTSEYRTFLSLFIAQNRWSYKDINTFITAVLRKGIITELEGHQFLSACTVNPMYDAEIDMDYIDLISKHISFLMDSGYLKEANEVYALLSEYKSRYSTHTTHYSTLVFEDNLHQMNIALINQNIEQGKLFYKQNDSIAKTTQDTTRIILNNIRYLPFLQLQQKLDEFILLCEYNLELEQNSPTYSEVYYTNIEALTEALILKSETDTGLISRIPELLELTEHSSDEEIRVRALGSYIDYIGLFSPDHPEPKRIMKKFNTNNILDFSKLVILKVANTLPPLEQINIFQNCSQTFFKWKYYKEARLVQIDIENKLRLYYNKELSTLLTKYELQSVEEAHAQELKIENTKQNYLILTTILLVFILLLTLVVIRLQKSKNTLLNSKNKMQKLWLKEIHHRIENNLQIATGLLNLRLGGLKNKETVDTIKTWEHQIQSMIQLHHHLYLNDSLSVHLYKYTESIITTYKTIYKATPFTYHINICPEQTLPTKTVLNLGLILSELINNALKHRLSTDDAFSISLTLNTINNKTVFIIQDSGQGLKPDLDFNTGNLTHHFGLNLIKNLSKQIGATITYTYNKGACFTISF